MNFYASAYGVLKESRFRTMKLHKYLSNTSGLGVWKRNMTTMRTVFASHLQYEGHRIVEPANHNL